MDIIPQLKFVSASLEKENHIDSQVAADPGLRSFIAKSLVG